MLSNGQAFPSGRLRRAYAYGAQEIASPRLPKAFGHGVMEGTMALSEGGHGPAGHGVSIDFLIIVTL